MTRLRLDWTDAAPWLYTLAMFALWELVVRVFGVPQFILPAPSRILEAIVQYWPAIWKNSLQTLYTTTLGFILAVVGGLALGILVGWSRFIYAGLYPLMIGFNAIPKVAVVPILVIWFGIGTIPAVLTAILEGRTGAISPTEFQFISTRDQVATVHAFMSRFPDILQH